MKAGSDVLVDYIKLLSRHADVISAAFFNHGMVPADAGSTAIRALQSRSVIIMAGEDEYRLNPSLNRHFEQVFERHKNFAIGENFGDQIVRLHKLCTEYRLAVIENRIEDSEAYLSDFDASAFELEQAISTQLDILRVMAENKFASVKTFAEKIRQNEHYIKRAEDISAALSAIQGDRIRDFLEDFSVFEPLSAIYNRRLIARMPEWSVVLMNTNKLLKDFLYRLRQIEPQARRIRSLALYLKNNPDFHVEEKEDFAETPNWATHSVNGRGRKEVYQDFSWGQTRDEMIPIALSVKRVEVEIARKKKTGTYIPDEGPLVAELELKPVNVAYSRYVAAASASSSPVSAIRWKRAQGDFDYLDDGSWIFHISHMVANSGPKSMTPLTGLNVLEILGPSPHPWIGNLVITDIQACKRA